MNMKLVLAILIFLFVIGGTFLVRISQTTSIDTNQTPSLPPVANSTTISPSNSSVNPPTPSSGISLAVLAQHNSQNDCWIAYRGKVYDITPFLGRHPGGVNAIARYCGSASEFENAFTRQHGTSKAGLLVNVATFIGDFNAQGGLAP